MIKRTSGRISAAKSLVSMRDVPARGNSLPS